MGDKQPVILLVEDDHADQEIVRRIAAQGGTSARIQTVSGGQEALDYLLRENQYAAPESSPTADLVLLDLNMPGMNGLETLSRIRAEKRTKLIPVVVLTTSDQESDIVQSYERGANSYLTKPVKYDEFVRVIRELYEYWFDLAVLPTAATS